MRKSLATVMTVIAAAMVFAVGTAWTQVVKAPNASQPAQQADANAQTARMEEQMKKMQAMHDRIVNARTAEERQKLMDEHRRLMQDSMGLMNQMIQGGGMMGSMGSGMTGGRGSGMMGQPAAPADPNARMEMMQKRMDMMQMMMQMMMDQQGMTGTPEAMPKK